MTFKWYIPVATLFLASIVVFIIVFLAQKYCFKRATRYKHVPQEEGNANKFDVVSIPSKASNESTAKLHPVYESAAETSISEAETYYEPVSAYGDQISYNSLERKSSLTNNSSVAVHASLLYTKNPQVSKSYIAGKIVNISTPTLKKSKSQFKVHVVVLPNKKYAIKTKWYNVEGNVVDIGEYFKFTFRSSPEEQTTTLRMRVYTRTNRHSFKNELCLGECFVPLSEIASARGGLTIKRTIDKRLPQVKFSID